MATFAQTPDPAANDPRKLKGKMITLGDFGAEDLGYLCLPDQAPVGGLVIIHDRFGLDDNTKRMTDRWAAKGYLAIAVDLYNGRTSSDPNQANTLLANLRLESAMHTIQAGIRLLKESPRLKVPRAGVIGYSSGGTIALMSAQQIQDLDAAACVNAVIAPRDKKISKYRVPICLVFPRPSENEPLPPGIVPFEKLMSDMRNPLELQYVPSAPEGFADPRSASYSPAHAEAAWKYVDAFLRRELSKPAKEPTLIDKVEDFFK